MKKEKELIKQMPDKQTLEAFVRGLSGGTRVTFNTETGQFEWVVPRPDPLLGQPKTELGKRWQRL